MSKIERRTFIKHAAAAAVGGGVLGAQADSVKYARLVKELNIKTN